MYPLEIFLARRMFDERQKRHINGYRYVNVFAKVTALFVVIHIAASYMGSNGVIVLFR